MLEAVRRYLIQNQVMLVLFLIALGWLLFEIKDILVLFFISYILMASLLPFVSFFVRRGLPRPLAIAITYTLLITSIVLFIFPLIQFGASQFNLLLESFPSYLNQVAQLFNIDVNSSQIQDFISSRIESIGSNAFSVTSQFLGGLFSVVTVIVMSFYLLLDTDRILHGIANTFPAHQQKRIEKTILQANDKLGGWLRGQMVLSLAVGTLVWMGLSLLGWSTLAIPLAVIAALFEIIPLIGPILGAIPAVIVALTISPATTAVVIGMYILIQLLENNLLVPKIMEKAVGLNPLVIIFGITVGAKVMGTIGALLSIPFLSLLVVLFKNYTED